MHLAAQAVQCKPRTTAIICSCSTLHAREGEKLMPTPAVPAGVQLLPFHSREAALPDLGPAASWPQLMQAEEGGGDGQAAQRTGLLTFFEPHSWHQVGSA